MIGCRRHLRFALVLATLVFGVFGPSDSHAAEPTGHGTITDRTITWPTWPQWRRVLLLEDYNTRLVLIGTTLLGGAAGTVGSFTLLRKRSLMGDALSHATLPGIGIAFVATTLAGADGKSLAVLLAGATISGLLGLAVILFIRNATRVKEDAALGIVLSVFFGAGVSVLGIAQQMETGHAAGLETFIYGKTASMVPLDAQLIGAAGLAVGAVCLLLFKELKLLCFDETFGALRGYPVVMLDVVLMALVVTVTIIGLQAVGLILMIALLVVPARGPILDGTDVRNDGFLRRHRRRQCFSCAGLTRLGPELALGRHDRGCRYDSVPDEHVLRAVAGRCCQGRATSAVGSQGATSTLASRRL